MRAAIGAIIEQCRDFGYILNENFSEIPYETYSAGKLEDLMLVFAQELQTNAYNQALEDAIRVASGYQQLGKAMLSRTGMPYYSGISYATASIIGEIKGLNK